jgi:hypothetical protein
MGLDGRDADEGLVEGVDGAVVRLLLLPTSEEERPKTVNMAELPGVRERFSMSEEISVELRVDWEARDSSSSRNLALCIITSSPSLSCR